MGERGKGTMEIIRSCGSGKREPWKEKETEEAGTEPERGIADVRAEKGNLGENKHMSEPGKGNPGKNKQMWERGKGTLERKGSCSSGKREPWRE